MKAKDSAHFSEKVDLFDEYKEMTNQHRDDNVMLLELVDKKDAQIIDLKQQLAAIPKVCSHCILSLTRTLTVFFTGDCCGVVG